MLKINLIFGTVLILVLSACQSKSKDDPSESPSEQQPVSTSKSISVPSIESAVPTISRFYPLAADFNAKVIVQGKNLKEGLELQLDDDTTVSLSKDENGDYYFIMPSGLEDGVLDIKFAGSEESISMPFYSLTEDLEYPIFSGDSAMICSDQKFYNADGELKDGTKDCSGEEIPTCSEDGEVGCKTTTTIKAAVVAGLEAKVKSGETVAGVVGTYEGSGAEPDAWDLRYGVTIGSVTGKLKVNCRNVVDANTYDNSNAPADVGVDIWDTIDDYDYGGAGGGGTIPTTNPWGSDQYFCGFGNPDEPTWERVETTPATNGQNSVFKDKMTGLMWTRGDSTVTSYWQDAVDYCNDLNHGGYDDWRLPTQKELMAAHVHGIYSLASTNTDAENLGSLSSFWSSTSVSFSSAEAWHVSLDHGTAGDEPKEAFTKFGRICVR